MESDDEFVEFATANAERLRRAALLLCGDWHTAQDLTQSTLAGVYVSWRRIRARENAYAFAQRTLVNTFLATRRRKSATELITGSMPDSSVAGASPELRIIVLQALAALTPKARAVVVLRYWEDLSVESVATILGCSAGNVKSQSARALDRLRDVLGDVHPLDAKI